MPTEASRAPIDLKWFIGSAATYAVALGLTIGSQSLWTDEAFSAYMACQRSVGAFFSTLIHGDSSDLQAALYYLYLHAWSLAFGSSELALRMANIPFIGIFSFTLVWISYRIFRSRWLWIPPAFMPFFWNYAGEVRAYFALVAFGTVCFGCLLTCLVSPSRKEQRILPWVALTSLFLGTAFHMLMLLALPPMLLIVLLHALRSNEGFSWRPWKPALQAFFIPFALLFVYLCWTFLRGTTYDYLKPDPLSMGSVFYRLAGLSGYGPNRRFDIPFHPYLPGIAAAAAVLLVVVACAVLAGTRKSNRLLLTSLVWAFLLGMSEPVVLSFVVKMQVDVRHLAALTPLMILLFLAAFNGAGDKQGRNLALVSGSLLAALWLIADGRMLFLKEYKDEDFRAAINEARLLYQNSKADIALVGDPVAGAYYGLDVRGDAPCFPLKPDCAAGLQKVDWAKPVPAIDAALWKRPEIESWLSEHARKNLRVIVVMSLSRHPMFKESDWWPILRSKPEAALYPVHGFNVFVF